jgi:hypothetical protein
MVTNQPCRRRFCVGGESVEPNVGHKCGNSFPLYESKNSEAANECGCTEIKEREKREIGVQPGNFNIDWDRMYDPAWFVEDQRWFTGTKLLCEDRLYYIDRPSIIRDKATRR